MNVKFHLDSHKSKVRRSTRESTERGDPAHHASDLKTPLASFSHQKKFGRYQGTYL